MRALLGGLTAALALTLAPQASANHVIMCAEGYEYICRTVDSIERLCLETKWTHC